GVWRVGGGFVGEAGAGVPLFLIAGGSGLVPLMALLRHRALAGSHVPARLLVSARTLEDLIYASELRERAGAADGLEVFTTLTRSAPSDWAGYRRRLDREMLAEVAWPPDELPRAFIC